MDRSIDSQLRLTLYDIPFASILLIPLLLLLLLLIPLLLIPLRVHPTMAPSLNPFDIIMSYIGVCRTSPRSAEPSKDRSCGRTRDTVSSPVRLKDPSRRLFSTADGCLSATNSPRFGSILMLASPEEARVWEGGDGNRRPAAVMTPWGMDDEDNEEGDEKGGQRNVSIWQANRPESLIGEKDGRWTGWFIAFATREEEGFLGYVDDDDEGRGETQLFSGSELGSKLGSKSESRSKVMRSSGFTLTSAQFAPDSPCASASRICACARSREVFDNPMRACLRGTGFILVVSSPVFESLLRRSTAFLLPSPFPPIAFPSPSFSSLNFASPCSPPPFSLSVLPLTLQDPKARAYEISPKSLPRETTRQ
mmetsp:Transcript_18092/g.33032  ORF Transcript_18092/g.33032 Transcript_18092/m.33032 type:complete len:364 (-) Transcript_18092:678-1769(-)